MASHGKKDTEDLRIFACDIIQNAGIQLKLPQVAMSTAQMLLQRVYHTRDYTFDRYKLDITAMATLFLAAKIEEYPRKADELIGIFTKVLSNKFLRKITLSQSDQKKVREDLITAERRILRNLGFNLLSSYPHKILTSYYQAIVNALDPENMYWSYQKNRRLLQIAWNYCNDSLRIDIFTKYSQEAVSCACIQMACDKVGMMFPKSTDGREWFQLFVDDPKEVEGATKMLEDLYRRKPPNLSDIERHIHLTRYYSR